MIEETKIRTVAKKEKPKGYKPIIGIITVPLSPKRRYYKVCGDSYISSAHIDWLKSAGLEILAIPYTTTDYEYYFKNINGLYLPSGGVFASSSEEYYKCCSEFIKLAIDANDKDDYFPVWGGCMGMQQMMIIADGKDNMNLLEKFDSFNNLMLPLIFTDEGVDSNMMADARINNPLYILELMSNDCTLNNHMLGLSPDTFESSGLLNSFYKIVSYNYDRKNQKFVSTIEGRKYPFYGVQWHPERDDNMGYFVNFFASEAKKNQHEYNLDNDRVLESKVIDCMIYSGNIYKTCNFYWHEKTSEHNKHLCNTLNEQKPDNSNV